MILADLNRGVDIATRWGRREGGIECRRFATIAQQLIEAIAEGESAFLAAKKANKEEGVRLAVLARKNIEGGPALEGEGLVALAHIVFPDAAKPVALSVGTVAVNLSALDADEQDALF